VLKNSQTDHVLTIVAHTMTAKLIGGGMFHFMYKFYVRDFRTKRKICIFAYRTLCFCVFVFLGMSNIYFSIS
jgi:hypothetical protein